jgi:hypothetical protein
MAQPTHSLLQRSNVSQTSPLSAVASYYGHGKYSSLSTGESVAFNSKNVVFQLLNGNRLTKERQQIIQAKYNSMFSSVRMGKRSKIKKMKKDANIRSISALSVLADPENRDVLNGRSPVQIRSQRVVLFKKTLRKKKTRYRKDILNLQKQGVLYKVRLGGSQRRSRSSYSRLNKKNKRISRLNLQIPTPKRVKTRRGADLVQSLLRFESRSEMGRRGRSLSSLATLLNDPSTQSEKLGSGLKNGARVLGKYSLTAAKLRHPRLLNSWRKRLKFLKGLTKHLAMGKPIKGSKRKKKKKIINKFKSFFSTVRAYDKKRRKSYGLSWWLMKGELKRRKAVKALHSLDGLVLYRDLLSPLASRTSRSYRITNRRMAALKKVVRVCNNLSVTRPSTTGVIRRASGISLGAYAKSITRLYNKRFKTIKVLRFVNESRVKKLISTCVRSRNALIKAERRVEARKQPRPTLDSENPNLSRRLKKKKLWFEARLAKAAASAQRKLKIAKFTHFINKKKLSNVFAKGDTRRLYTKSGGSLNPRLNRSEFRRLTNESSLLMGSRKRSTKYLRRLIAGWAFRRSLVMMVRSLALKKKPQVRLIFDRVGAYWTSPSPKTVTTPRPKSGRKSTPKSGRKSTPEAGKNKTQAPVLNKNSLYGTRFDVFRGVKKHKASKNSKGSIFVNIRGVKRRTRFNSFPKKHHRRVAVGVVRPTIKK